MKRILVLLALLASAAAQTTTSVTGILEDLTQAAVTSGKVTLTLEPSIDTTISGVARFYPSTVTCPIALTGNIVSLGNQLVTETSGTTSPGTSVVVLATTGEAVNQAIAIPGAGANGAVYIGTITNIAGTTLTVSPATSTAVNGGTSVYSPCQVTMNTSLNPPGSYYRVDVWPYSVKTSSFTFYAVLASYDWSTVVPTPTTSPAQNYVDIFSNQTIAGNKTFTGNTSLTGATSISEIAGTIGGTATWTGLQTFDAGWELLSAGVFSNAQMNEYAESLLNSVNLQTEFSSTQGANSATDAVAGGAAVPSAATAHQINAVAGYINTACNASGGTVCNPVALYGNGRIVNGATGASMWGVNTVVQDGTGTTGSQLTGNENDINLPAGSAPLSVFGFQVNGSGTGTMPAAFAPGANPVLVDGATAEGIIAPNWIGSGGYAWPTGYTIFRGSVSGTALQVDAPCTPAQVPCSSNPISFTGYDSGNNAHTVQEEADSNGDLIVMPAAGSSSGVGDATFGSKQFGGPSYCETAGASTSLSTTGATTNSGQTCLPANAIIDAVVYRIINTITTATSFTIGDSTTAARFCATQSTLTAGTTGICYAQADQSGAGGPKQATAASVRVTANTTPAAGAIRLIVYYHSWTPPQT